MQDWIPVDQALAAVNQPRLMQAHKGLVDCVAELGIHGEAIPGPVQGQSHPAQLLADLAGGLLLPLPDLVDKSFSAELLA